MYTLLGNVSSELGAATSAAAPCRSSLRGEGSAPRYCNATLQYAESDGCAADPKIYFLQFGEVRLR